MIVVGRDCDGGEVTSGCWYFQGCIAALLSAGTPVPSGELKSGRAPTSEDALHIAAMEAHAAVAPKPTPGPSPEVCVRGGIIL